MPEIIEYGTGNCFQLCDQFLVGRSLECTHIIEDISISRKHCKFTVQNNKWFITDLSANGIFVNDLKVLPKKPFELKNNDSIQISTYLFGFRTEQEEVPDYTNAEVIEVDTLDTVIEIDDTSALQSPAKTETTTAAHPPATASATPEEIEFDDELTCSICAELFINAVTLNCQHSFCELCILKWKKNSKKCPICRHDIKSQHSSLTINNMVALLSSKKSQEEKDIRKATLESRMTEFQALTATPAAVARARTRAPRGRGRGRQQRGAATRQRQTGRHLPPPAHTAAGGADDFIDLSSDSSTSDSDVSYFPHDMGVMQAFFEHFEAFY